MSQAPGLSGIPVRGQCSSAVSRASWARSSARPTSRTTRTRPPISRADSILQTASMAWWVAASVIGSGLLVACGLLRPHFGAPPLHPRAQLGGEFLAEVLRLEDRADLDLRLLARHRIRATPDPLHRLLQRLHLPDPEARDELLCLGKRPVDDRLLPAREAHPLAPAARMEPVGGEQHAGLDELLVEIPHRDEVLLLGQLAGLGVLRRLHQHHDSHCSVPFRSRVSRNLRTRRLWVRDPRPPRTSDGPRTRPRTRASA